VVDYSGYIPLDKRPKDDLNIYEKVQLAWQQDPEMFVEEVLGYTLWSRQVEIFELVRDNKYTSIASGHNIGKTFVTAAICIWFVLSFPHAAVLTTASTFDQVKKILWKEIRRLLQHAVWPIGGDLMPKHPRFDLLDRFMEGFGFAKPDSVQGCHNPNILIVFDEAQAIDEPMAWDAFSSMLTGEYCKHLCIGNPIYAHGPFPQTHKLAKWTSLNISCLEHPNVVERRTVIQGAVTYQAIDELRDSTHTGPGSEYWLTRVLGNFPQQGADILLPEYMVRRCMNLPPNHPKLKGSWMGFDVASTGGDRCVVAVMVDGMIEELVVWNSTGRAEDGASKALTIADKWEIPFKHINVDAVGPVGGQYKLAFAQMGVPVNTIYNGQTPLGDWDVLWPQHKKGVVNSGGMKMFLNRRAELHWVMRTVFEREYISLRRDKDADSFIYEACQIKYGYKDNGVLWIESKPNSYVPRTGFSPDISDAVLLTLARDAVYRRATIEEPG